MNNEEWRDVVGHEGLYLVSDAGNVRSLDRIMHSGERGFKGQTLAPGIGPNGYPLVVLCKDGARKSTYVHHLVLEAFIGPRPDGFDCCHRDGTRANNRAGNLRWGTRKENMADCVAHGRSPRGERSPRAKLSEMGVRVIRRLLERGAMLHKDIANVFGVSRGTVASIKSGDNWAWLEVPHG